MIEYCKEVTENEGDKKRVNQKTTKKSKRKERNWIEKQGNEFCSKNEYRFVRFKVGNTQLGW